MPSAQVETAGFPGSGRAGRVVPSDRLWPRRLLAGILVTTILLGLGLIAWSQGQPDPDAPAALPTSRLVENRTMAELASLPGFQRRGNSVVGEVCTRDGQSLRLVLDARSQALIGFRVVETADNQNSCTHGFLLPRTQSPAN